MRSGKILHVHQPSPLRRIFNPVSLNWFHWLRQFQDTLTSDLYHNQVSSVNHLNWSLRSLESKTSRFLKLSCLLGFVIQFLLIFWISISSIFDFLFWTFLFGTSVVPSLWLLEFMWCRIGLLINLTWVVKRIYCSGN